MRTSKDRSTPLALRSPAVAFAHGAATLKAKSRPEFEHEWGEYAPAPISIVNGVEPPGVEQEIDCPGSIVIYSSWAEFVETCEGWGDDNFVVVRARDAALAAAAKITCKEAGKGCTRRFSDIWRGWDCTPEVTRLKLVAAVEVAVICQVEY
jgi:hypothetical protein